ncbi:MAG: hypothetical protein CM1200mP35_01830 [Chloroflexota bacterium]|nr:MAG: hypothetical protein CM1200mP35_01830 [Chloroflexota bacterium]
MLTKQICRSFDFELQAAATDDGLNFSLGPGFHSQSMTYSLYQIPKRRERFKSGNTSISTIRDSLEMECHASLSNFEIQWGKKVPPPFQRMRSDDLLAAVFPAQVACQDNASREIEIPDHPLTFETMRDCLTQAMDLIIS